MEFPGDDIFIKFYLKEQMQIQGRISDMSISMLLVSHINGEIIDYSRNGIITTRKKLNQISKSDVSFLTPILIPNGLRT